MNLKMCHILDVCERCENWVERLQLLRPRRHKVNLTAPPLFKNELENVKVHYMEYATSGFNMALLFCDERPSQLLRFHALSLDTPSVRTQTMTIGSGSLWKRRCIKVDSLYTLHGSGSEWPKDQALFLTTVSYFRKYIQIQIQAMWSACN